MSAWTFEPGDPTVGIFGEGWVHECDTEADQHLLAAVNRASGATEFVYLLTCLECAAQRLVSQYEYTGWDQPDDFSPWDPTGVDCHEAYESAGDLG